MINYAISKKMMKFKIKVRLKYFYLKNRQVIFQKEQIDETYAIDVKVIHTEPANLDNKSFMKMEKSLIAIDNIEEKVNTYYKNNYLCDSILFKITIVYLY